MLHSICRYSVQCKLLILKLAAITVIPVCGALLQVLLHIFLRRYHSRSVVSHDAIVVIASVGAPLPIDAGLRIESKNGTTFHTIFSAVPIYATTTLASCGATLRLRFPIWRAATNKKIFSGRHNYWLSHNKVY
jgi:hypothetical protein